MRTEHINEHFPSSHVSSVRETHEESVKDFYIDLTMTAEKVSRLFSEVIERELSKLPIYDISSVQAMILFRIGKNQPTVNEIIYRGYYLGSNVSYNLHKMIESGYVVQTSVPNDKRSVRISLSLKGFDLFEKLEKALESQALLFQEEVMNERDSDGFSKTMKKMEKFLFSLVQNR
jgi:DNA-binding MarR family transcriptional regulator